MTYEKGSFSREMREAHRAGDHEGKLNPLCLQCSLSIETSPDEWSCAVLSVALTYEEILSEHRAGKHAREPHQTCVHEDCLKRQTEEQDE